MDQTSSFKKTHSTGIYHNLLPRLESEQRLCLKISCVSEPYLGLWSLTLSLWHLKLFFTENVHGIICTAHTHTYTQTRTHSHTNIYETWLQNINGKFHFWGKVIKSNPSRRSQSCQRKKYVKTPCKRGKSLASQQSLILLRYVFMRRSCFMFEWWRWSGGKWFEE